MNRKLNVLNNILTMLITAMAVFLVSYFCNKQYVTSITKVIGYLLTGAVISGFFCTLFHELGHLIVGKINGFDFISVTVWFFRWTKKRNGTTFDFVLIGDAGGSTEMIAKGYDNLTKRFKKMTLGGLIPDFVLMLVGLIPLAVSGMPIWLYCILSMFLPVGAYCFFGNALPMVNEGARNDGAVLLGIGKNDDEWKVTLSLLTIQSELYAGKTPSEIDEKLYFDLPQLPEDSLNFILLLNARYNYYLDKEDYESAKKISDRLIDLCEYTSKPVEYVLKTDALYNACTFDFNAEKADDLMFELEKYLNGFNTLTNVRVKLAYLLYVKRNKDNLALFYKKCVREANKCVIKGLVLFEKKLLDKMKNEF